MRETHLGVFPVFDRVTRSVMAAACMRRWRRAIQGRSEEENGAVVKGRHGGEGGCWRGEEYEQGLQRCLQHDHGGFTAADVPQWLGLERCGVC